MTLSRTTEPAAEPVTLAEAKANLRLDHDGEDELVEGLIRAAREEVETATGLALIEQHWRLCLDRLPRSGEVLLRRHPVREIVSVTIYDRDGAANIVDPAHYMLFAGGRPARLIFEAVPGSDHARNGIEIDFRAGFGEAGTDVPDLIKRAILMLVAHWYEFRASFGAARQPVGFPEGYDRLIAPYRMRRL
jgi:uncharacterized phiE125 gp8 family phage protein